MPINIDVATEQWMRYQYCRDRGHLQFLEKANLCEEFFAGNQWAQEDLSALRAQRRPALTINKVCLSGLDAIALADQLIRAGEFEVVVAGGNAPGSTKDAPVAAGKPVDLRREIASVLREYGRDDDAETITGVIAMGHTPESLRAVLAQG